MAQKKKQGGQGSFGERVKKQKIMECHLIPPNSGVLISCNFREFNLVEFHLNKNVQFLHIAHKQKKCTYQSNSGEFARIKNNFSRLIATLLKSTRWSRFVTDTFRNFRNVRNSDADLPASEKWWKKNTLLHTTRPTLK